MNTAPLRSRPISSVVGGATLTTTSACQGSPISAPAPVYASSRMLAASPAPASTTTPTPSLDRRCTTSGTMATRRSPGADSFGTPSFMRRGRVPIDWSVGALGLLALPVELAADAQSAHDLVGLLEVRRVAHGE